MEAAEGQGLVIKLAQKNKETQTVKLGAGGGLANNWFGYGADGAAAFSAHHPMAHHPAGIPPNPRVQTQFYMDREEQLYRRACQLKGIRLNKFQADDGSTGSDEEPSKTVYRYTLDEMKSYNPYRFINI